MKLKELDLFEDGAFVESMLVPAKRRIQINRFKRERKVLFILGIVVCVWIICGPAFPKIYLGHNLVGLIFTLIYLGIYFYVDSRLKMLKTFEKMGATAARHSGPPIPAGEDAV